MRHSGQIAGNLRSVSDRSAGAVLAMLGETDALPRRRRLLGSVLAGTVAAAALLPAAFSAVMDVSLAMPAGFAFAAALGLLAGGLVLAATAPAAPSAAPSLLPDLSAIDLLPGLVLALDERGHVVSRHGLDGAGLGRHLGAAPGQLLVDAIHVSDRIAFLAALDALRQGEPRVTTSLRVPREDGLEAEAGQFLSLGFDISAICRADGSVALFLATVTDETALEALKADKAALEAGVQSAHATKTRFLAAVSHELRTPLNAILGFSDMLKSGYAGPITDPRQTEYVGLIHDSGQHLLDVVNSMLAMSKIEAGRYELFKEPFAVSDVLKSVDEMLGLQAREKGVVLTTRCPRDLGELLADRRAVSQILINLVGNAVKFTEKGGVVSVDASRQGGQIILSVSDTGIGIPADRLADIGQPFMQVQGELARQYEGTGLGLSLVKGLVSLHGGRFEIDSRQGEGTVVTIALPVDGEGDVAIAEFPPRLNAGATAGTSAGTSAVRGMMIMPGEEGHGRPAAKTA